MGTNDIYLYFVRLPDGIDECVISCCGGYTIYIDSRLSDKQKREAYEHAMKHINYGHFDIDCPLTVDEMECEAHYG